MELTTENINKAAQRLESIIIKTPLLSNKNLSNTYKCEVFLKREDQQVVRSYKIRGAYNFMSQQPDGALKNGVVCASAGNHAQGVAYSCFELKVHGTIYMPYTTPKQKVDQVRDFGKEYVDIVLEGDTFDDAFLKAQKLCLDRDKLFVHPFDQIEIMEGQGTVGKEIFDHFNIPPDYIFLPIGGGGL